MIKVLIVDDSSVARQLLTHILTSDAQIQVIGAVANGEEALQFLAKQQPDVITMDVHMPRLDGFETTRQIMETVPIPVVIVTGDSNPRGDTANFRSTEAGALALVEKPPGIGHPRFQELAQKLVRVVKSMSEVRVVKRWSRARMAAATSPAAAIPARMTGTAPSAVPDLSRRTVKVVAIGVSTGGPPVLQTILRELPESFPVPILVVQHIAAGFVEGMAQWLGRMTNLTVKVAGAGEETLAGHVYLAPDGVHMGATINGKIQLHRGAPEHSACPSVSYLFRSVARVYADKAVGILLTGMGKDGAQELKELKDRGAITVAQDKQSSVVHGMPGEAIALGGVTSVLPPPEIAAMLCTLAKNDLLRKV
jgi:two-component system chemotaxis response regulator CheB